MGKQWKQCQTLFFGSPKSLQMVTAAMKLKDAYSLEGKLDQPRQHIQRQRHYFANKGPSNQGLVFPVVMYGCDSSIVKKSECWRFDAFELWSWRRLESPLECKEIQPVHPKGDQTWVFIGRTDAEAEIPILWLPHAKSWLIGKDPDAGRDWARRRRGQQRMR